MRRTAADMSDSELDKVINERREACMLLMRWLKKHPDSPLATQTRTWLTKNSKPEDIFRVRRRGINDRSKDDS